MNKVTLLTHLNDMLLNETFDTRKYINLLHRTYIIKHTHLRTHARTRVTEGRGNRTLTKAIKAAGLIFFLIRALNFDKLTYRGFIVGKLQSGKPDRLENFYLTKPFGLYLFI